MILGKFMPPHRGHRYLVDFARSYVQHLTVLVCSIESEPIPGELRFAWVRELFPYVEVLHVTDENPQEPVDHPDFWRIWRETIARAMPRLPGCVFTSESYGEKLAEVLGARHVLVDPGRELVPISASRIREDPLGNWRYIPECVRPYFARRVCIFGPESTGKSTLVRDLARHYDTVFAGEYARPLLAPKDGVCHPEDIPLIARGQAASEDALMRQANRVLFCDTDLLTTTIWSEVLFGDCPEWIRAEAERREYDLYLLTDIDVPWVDDAQRYLPNEREAFMESCVLALESRGRPYRRIRGSWDARMESACAAVDELLDRRPGKDNG